MVGGVSASVYFYVQWKETLVTPDMRVAEEIGEIVKRISKVVEVPATEVPILSTVIDREGVKDQLFFSRAENGDKILVYNDAKKAVLYRPSTGQVIEIGPVYVDTTTSTVIQGMQ
jgi:hypothetical protein